MSEGHPILVVVGHANRGKSTLIATLAERPDVPIDPRPGTTRQVHRYEVRIDGATVLELVDTPGFESASEVLERLDVDGARSSEAVRAVIDALDAEAEAPDAEAGAGAEDLAPERRLLRPVLDGGLVVYVVDGSFPYREHFEAEMEILRRTGRPRMAIINHTRQADCSRTWVEPLRRHFNLHKKFDAADAGPAERIALLRSFREMDEGHRDAFDRAIEAIDRHHRRQQAGAAARIAEMLTAMLTHTETVSLPKGERPVAQAPALESAYRDALRGIEGRAHDAVHVVYGHHHLDVAPEPLTELAFDDLFARRVWSDLGLSPRQLAVIGLIGGGMSGGGAGAAIDGLSGGGTLGAGTLFGTAIGGMGGAGAAYLYAGGPLAEVRHVGRRFGWGRGGEGGQAWRIGPPRDRNLAWIALDRALIHWMAVRGRAHGNRMPLSDLSSGETVRAGFTAALAPSRRRAIARALARCVKKRDPQAVSELTSEIDAVMTEIVGRGR